MVTLTNNRFLQRGAIIGLDIFNPLASVIRFQYNPHTLTRTLTPRAENNGDSAAAKPQMLVGAPSETISLEVEINAADQLDRKDSIAQAAGIYPQLSALEMLLYPKTAEVIFNTVLMATGVQEIIPTPAPMTLFIWGIKRVLPVKVESFSITEQIYDADLNPILANVSLSLRVLNYNDFAPTHPGFWAFMAHQVVKETMATINSANTIRQIF